MLLFELKLKSVNPSEIFNDLEENVFYTLVCDHPFVVYNSIEDQQIKLKDLIPTQPDVDNTSVENYDPIIAAKRNDKIYIIDGHHRYARDRRLKKDMIDVCVIELPQTKIEDLKWFEQLFKRKLKQVASGNIVLA